MDESALTHRVVGDFLTRGGQLYYRIDGTDLLPPFFLSLVGPGDGWAFLSSDGAITAGRISPDHALFPYRTDDQLLDAVGTAGSRTVILGHDRERRAQIWRPLSSRESPIVRTPRALEKSLLGDEITLEEDSPELGLRFSLSWRMSPAFGLVRTTTVTNIGQDVATFQLTDGIVNLLPPTVPARTQRELSNLLDAYKLTELDPDRAMVWTRLNSGLTDLAEPAESLRASTAWLSGLPGAELTVNARGGSQTLTRGERAALLAATAVTLRPGAQLSWRLVMDIDQDAAEVATLREDLGDPQSLVVRLDEDLEQARRQLRALVASADGLQATGDAQASAHHTSSVLFNIMRGGVPVDGLGFPANDLRRFLERRHRGFTQKHAATLAQLPSSPTMTDLAAVAGNCDDPDARRLLGSYLPLTFSRRHGDPTRPWNTFTIAVADEQGDPILRYEGNWRDIFQNWEALAYSFPTLTDVMIRIFLDSMTIDGYNPYRISSDGVDWEVPEPEDPWSNIGYWSDHQVVYLDALLTARKRLIGPWSPQRLLAADHVYADVPYRIDDYQQLLVDPSATIDFDLRAHEAALARSEEVGGDGRLVVDHDGAIVRASMLEKLLLIVAAKMVNFVPGSGIWMNTQRPEWNDANNALVGRGVSVVTTAQLYGFIDHLLELIEVLGPDHDVPVSQALAHLWTELCEVLSAHRDLLAAQVSPADRKSIMDQLGPAGEVYRKARYSDPRGSDASLTCNQIRAGLTVVRQWVGHAIDHAWRTDGLISSYATMTWDTDRTEVVGLGPMLEGQVAVLASGALSPERSLALLKALRASSLWCPQRRTYLLYPDRQVAGLLERNRLAPALLTALPLLKRLLDDGDRRLVVRGTDGVARFAGPLQHSRDVHAALDALAGDPAYAVEVEVQRADVVRAFEDTFGHAEFTGRSGSFFAYEGLGSVYWHMVSKLLWAVRGTIERARTLRPDLVPALEAAAEDIRSGLGHTKTPAEFGAVPIDPYSHTPSGHGARQPGMTGQVKEDILIRWDELGVEFAGGEVTFHPDRVHSREWLTIPSTLTIDDADPAQLDLAAGALGFTWCQTPVVYHRDGAREIRIHDHSGSRTVAGWTLPAEVCRAVAQRDGSTARIEVFGS